MSPSDISYQTIEGVAGNYFQCDRYGKLSVDRCASNFATAPRAQAVGRLSGCIGCPVGVMHAGGQTVESSAPAQLVCVRCRRNPSVASGYGPTRQGKVRMVRDGELCVSCYNRGREVAKGKNARGTRPKKLKLLATYVAYPASGTRKAMWPDVLDELELSLTLAKRNVTSYVALIPGVASVGPSETDPKP